MQSGLMRRIAAIVALVAVGGLVLPNAWSALEITLAGDDPAALADLQLKQMLTPSRIASEIDAALIAEDEDLASSLMKVAGDNNIASDPSWQKRLDALQATATRRAARDFANGFVHGDKESGAALAGALTGDMTGYGDVRDLYREGNKLVAGEPADELVIGLAGAGLALSAATWASLGGTLPARGGVSLIKATQKAGQLSKPLTVALVRTAATSIDKDALRMALASTGRLNLAAAREGLAKVIRPAAVSSLKAVGEDVAKVYSHTGLRGARQALAVAESNGELRQAARLAAAKGPQTRGVLKLLGRSALVVAGIGLVGINWTVAFAGWLIALAVVILKVIKWLYARLKQCVRRQATARF